MVGIWLGAEPLVLASGSRTRVELLAGAGLTSDQIKPDVDERRIEADSAVLAPVELAMRLAAAKAEEVAGRYRSRVVVSADQVLETEGELLHKPADLQDAARHLLRLQGRTHVLHSAVAIVNQEKTETFFNTAKLSMRPLSRDAIDAYLRFVGEDRVVSSVGGYQLEGLGIHLFERIEGEHATVLGLPLLPLLARLRAMHLLAIS